MAPDQTTTALDSRLHDPGVAQSLATILDHADLLALLVESLDQFVSRSEVIGDSLVASIHDIKGAEGVERAQPDDLSQIAEAGATLAKSLPSLAPRLANAAHSGDLDNLLDSAAVTAQALPQVELIARSLVTASEDFPQAAVEVSGPLSLLKLLRDPDINRAVSFLATLAQSLGRELAKPVPHS